MKPRSVVATIDLDRLATVLGMLGSAHDSEVIAAACQAERLRTEAGFVWSDLIQPPATLPAQQRPKKASSPKKAKQPKAKRQSHPDHFDLGTAASIREAVDFVLASSAANEWERGFLNSIRQRLPPLSEKQEETLARLIEKGRRAREGAA